MKPSLFTLGNLTVDDIVLYESQQLFLNSSGGDALFAAIGAWIWNKNVGMIARAGFNYPERNIRLLEDAGIDCFLKRISNQDVHTWTLYEPGGKRQFIYHLSSGTYEEMSITGAEIPTDCLGRRAYHIAPLPILAQGSIIERLRQQDCLISLDQFNQHLGDPDINSQARQMISQVDFFLPSSVEAAILHGKDDPEGAAIDFAATGLTVVCIKMGDKGALLHLAESGKTYHIPICQVNTLDPTGAGDSFCGGFLAGYLASQDPIQAACCGAVSASYIIQKVGALSVLETDFSDINERFENVRSRVRMI